MVCSGTQDWSFDGRCCLRAALAGALLLADGSQQVHQLLKAAATDESCDRLCAVM